MKTNLFPSPTHVSTAERLKKPFIADFRAKFFAHLRNFCMFASLLGVLTILGCSTTENRPVLIQVTEAPVQGSRYRVLERQRDVWIAPQVIDHETLQHEQLVTFVEKPMTWQLSSTMEPNAISKPELPLEVGDYDAEALRREREIIIDTQSKLKNLAGELESFKKKSSQEIYQKENQIRKTEGELQSTCDELTAARKRLEDIAAAEKLKQEEEAKHKAKSWWKVW